MIRGLNVVRLSSTSILPVQRSNLQGYTIRSPKRAVIYPNKTFSIFLGYNLRFPPGTAGLLSSIPHLVVNNDLNVISVFLHNSFSENHSVIIHNLSCKHPLYIKRGDDLAYLTLVKNYCPKVLDCLFL